MKKLATFLLSYCLVGLLLAQQPEKPVVVWDSTSAGCKVMYLNGEPYEHMENAAVVVDVHPPRKKEKRIDSILIGVVNISQSELDVNPKTWSAVAGDAEATSMPYLDGGYVLRKEERHDRRMQAIGNGLSGFGAGMQTHTATVSNSDGSSSTVTYHDSADTANANAAAANRSALMSQSYERASSAVLRRNTLSSGLFVVGTVFFDRPKGLKADIPVRSVDIELNGTIYRFPLKEIEASRRK